MVWQFIGVYIINRTLHGRLEKRNFSSRVEKIFHSKRNFVSPRGHIISIYQHFPFTQFLNVSSKLLEFLNYHMLRRFLHPIYCNEPYKNSVIEAISRFRDNGHPKIVSLLSSHQLPSLLNTFTGIFSATHPATFS